jgi:hypothetical protein
VATKPGTTRFLLDTNVWRYVVDAGCAGRLLKLAAGPGVSVLIAPSVVYETLRISDPELRRRLIKLQTDRRLERLMPEAYSEACEVLEELRRIHPEWLRASPHLDFVKRLEADWRKKTGGFWVRCERSPESEAQLIDSSSGPALDRARDQAKSTRQEMIQKIGWKNNPPMDKTMMGFLEPTSGWRGDPVHAWRIDAWSSLTYALREECNAYRDWVAPYLDVDGLLLLSPSWLSFWLYEADQCRLPRQWLRWAVSFAQRFRKASPGAPCDSQLSTYLMEADYFITADKALVDIVEECRPYSPAPLTATKLIAAGLAGVTETIGLLPS